jgi:hypothetical protein
MSILSSIIFSFCTVLFATNEKTITISPLESIQLNYIEFKDFDVEIQNKSFETIEVAVIDTVLGEKTKGFGLNARGNAVVSVAEGSLLQLTNSTTKTIKITIDFVEKKENSILNNNQYVSFTLVNSSAKSIPLIIPNVMNPNLSPFSESGVSLAIGQKIFFKNNGKKELLLQVDATIQEGMKLDVAKLIKQRKK